MPYCIDYYDDHVETWTRTPDGVQCERDETYSPTLYAICDDPGEGSDLAGLEAWLSALPSVVDTHVEEWRRGWRHSPEPVLRIDVDRIKAVKELAWDLRERDAPGAYKCFNVDLSREFRYCLETDVDPTPSHDLRRLDIALPPQDLAVDRLTELTIDDQPVGESTADVLAGLREALDATDPDVLVLSTSDLIPLLDDAAADHAVDLDLGRRPGYQQLAHQSRYESYGRVGHSPARYNVPGRVIVDQSNTFFYNEAGLPGVLNLVERSRKPIQELAWASIGNVLTAIQIREAMSRGVLVPWKSWRHEQFKSMQQLHDADRGGHTLAPDVGIHDDVHELDFASLYPNIICEYNVSPETTRCDCHDRRDVPGLGYSICDDQGYLTDVLQPLIDDREAIKAELRAGVDDPDREQALAAQSSAIKWILVSCFGYQGFSNAKYGRIECHEAINAYARRILLDAKATLEDHGWRLVHGIVDSLWVTAMPDEPQTPLKDVAAKISRQARVRLDYEARYDWVAFVPLADSEEGALTKYFGRKKDGEYKYRGIECRQRSTPPYIEALQEDLIEVLNRRRDPAAVVDALARYCSELHAGGVDTDDLVVRQQVSKPLGDYRQSTRGAAALERAELLGFDRYPGQDVKYVVVNDDASGAQRVRLGFEDGERYDPGFYEELAIRACESVVSPVGWRRHEIEQHLEGVQDATLSAFQSQ
jgi:DNA polymerase I